MASVDQPKHPSNMHTVFLGECTQYFQWMSVGMFHSHKKAGQPGPITRVMCCSDDERAALPQSWLDLGPTHVAKSMAKNTHNGDWYGAYNKPYAVIDFLENSPPKEEWLVIADSDMIMRLPFLCKGETFEHGEDASLEMNCERGRPISAYYGYLKGTNNNLAERHIPHILPRNNTDGGQPWHRRSDRVGGFVLVHRDDMLQYMHDWLTITEDVRGDAEAWHLSGDVYSTKPGMKPWISEMYGYSFAAAKHGMWHQTDHISMQYPDYIPTAPARLMHYGLEFTINTKSTPFKFDKHHHYHFDALSCDVTKHGKDLGALFPMPPAIAELTSPTAGRERLADLQAIETILTLNEAFCQHHSLHCLNGTDTAGTMSVSSQCEAVYEASEALQAELWRIGSLNPPDEGALCQDHGSISECEEWVKRGECVSNPDAMAVQCLQSCGMCLPVLPNTQLGSFADVARHNSTKNGTAGQDNQTLMTRANETHGNHTTPNAGTRGSPLAVEAPNLKTNDATRNDRQFVENTGHKLSVESNGAQQLRVISAQTKGTTDTKVSAKLTGQRMAAHDVGSTKSERLRSTARPQVQLKATGGKSDMQDQQSTVHGTNGAVTQTSTGLPAAYGVASLSLWLLVVAMVLALGSATRKSRRRTPHARTGPRTPPRMQHPDIGEFL